MLRCGIGAKGGTNIYDCPIPPIPSSGSPSTNCLADLECGATAPPPPPPPSSPKSANKYCKKLKKSAEKKKQKWEKKCSA